MGAYLVRPIFTTLSVCFLYGRLAQHHRSSNLLTFQLHTAHIPPQSISWSRRPPRAHTPKATPPGRSLIGTTVANIDALPPCRRSRGYRCNQMTPVARDMLRTSAAKGDSKFDLYIIFTIDIIFCFRNCVSY